ncbi:MAG: flavodoxin [Candidatus Saccharibacteria bacterium]|nr:flavodoxin [Candidatus Saccharibacteria bacterium]
MDYSDIKVVFFNTTLKKSPAVSNTDGIIEASQRLYEQQGASVEVIRSIDHAIASGVQPDMTKKGWDVDEWPELYKKVKAADIVIIAGPIWLGDNSSETKKIIERLYSNSGDMNDKGQAVYYGKVGAAMITGNEDGVKHCSSNILYSLQHVGFTIPPEADAGWIGEIGPGPSYLDEGSGGPENDFTNRHITFMTWNTLHFARMLRDAGGVPAYGNMVKEWKDGNKFGFSNPEYRK